MSYKTAINLHDKRIQKSFQTTKIIISFEEENYKKVENAPIHNLQIHKSKGRPVRGGQKVVTLRVKRTVSVQKAPVLRASIIKKSQKILSSNIHTRSLSLHTPLVGLRRGEKPYQHHTSNLHASKACTTIAQSDSVVVQHM